MLASFFEKYLYYKKKTHVLIPFVKSPDSQDIMKSIIKNARPDSVYNDRNEKAAKVAWIAINYEQLDKKITA